MGLFSKKKQRQQVDVSTLALLPLYQLFNDDAPFNDWRDEDVPITDGMEEFFRGLAWMYQLFAYYMLVISQFGREIADEMLAIQVDRLSEVDAGFASEIESGIGLIEQLVREALATEPLKVEVKGEEVEVPEEYRIGMHFLITDPESPYHTPLAKLKAGEQPNLQDSDMQLMVHLAKSKEVAIEYFQPLLEVSELRD